MDEDDDELTILVGAAQGSTALERDGMLRRLEESVTLAIAECTNEGYLTNGMTGEVDISLTVAAPGLASPEVLSLVGDSVAELINDPANPGWGPFSVSVTGESGDENDALDDLVEDLQVLEGFNDLDDLRRHLDNGTDDDHDDDFDGPLVVITDGDGLRLTGIAVGRDTEAGRNQLRRSATALTGIDLAWLTALDLSEGDEAERELALDQARYVAGGLFQASVAVVDQLFIDLDTLTRDGTTETVADAPDDVFFVLGGLPPRYADRYDALFTQQLIVAMADVTRRLTAGWEPLACVAQELAMRLILDATEVQLDLVDVKLDQGWRAAAEDAFFEDPDHEMLFDPQTPDVEDEDLRVRPDSAPMGFSFWFTPFNADRHLPPYLVEAVEGVETVFASATGDDDDDDPDGDFMVDDLAGDDPSDDESDDAGTPQEHRQR